MVTEFRLSATPNYDTIRLADYGRISAEASLIARTREGSDVLDPRRGSAASSWLRTASVIGAAPTTSGRGSLMTAIAIGSVVSTNPDGSRRSVLPAGVLRNCSI